jgi:hypothetical protein
MTDARSSGDRDEASGSGGSGPLLRSIGERAPLTEAECELVGALSAQGLQIAGLTLVRDERTGQVFVQQMLPPAADDRGPPKAGRYDIAALTVEGMQARQRGRYDVAVPCLLLALRLRLRVSGLDDPETVMSLNHLGETLHENGDLVGARELFEVMHQICLGRVGTDHDYTLCAANNLAAVLFDQDHLAAACELQQTVYETLRCERLSGSAVFWL